MNLSRDLLGTGFVLNGVKTYSLCTEKTHPHSFNYPANFFLSTSYVPGSVLGALNKKPNKIMCLMLIMRVTMMIKTANTYWALVLCPVLFWVLCIYSLSQSSPQVMQVPLSSSFYRWGNRERERLKKQSCWSQDWNTVSVNSVHPCGKPVQQKYVCNAVKFLRTEVSPLSFEPRGISAQICLSKGSRWVSGPQVGVWLLANLLQCGELGIQEAEMKLLHLLSGSFQIYGALSATGEFRVTRKNAFGCVWMVSPS